MQWHGWFLALVCLIGGNTAGAQTTTPTQQELEARLKSHFLMLRGMWDGSKLAFDAQGNLVGTAHRRAFSLSAMLVHSVRLTDFQLEIKGDRAALVYTSSNVANPVRSGGGVKVVIARDHRHPEELDAAVSQVFSIRIDEALARSAPEYWRKYLAAYLGLPGAEKMRPGSGGLDEGPPEPRSALPDNPGPDENGFYRLSKGNGVAIPRLVRAPDPTFTEAARAQKYGGTVIVGMVVDTSGRPQSIYIIRPTGLGLDENAVATVGQYEFKPATYQGKPVPVKIHIEVSFRIW